MPLSFDAAFVNQVIVARSVLLNFLIVYIANAGVIINFIIFFRSVSLISLLWSDVARSIFENLGHLFVQFKVVLLDLNLALFS